MLTFGDDESVRGWIATGVNSEEVALLLVDNGPSLDVAKSILKGQNQVALDWKREGVIARSEGEIKFLYVGVRAGILLFDLSSEQTVSTYFDMISYLGELLGDASVTKVVRDVRDVSDRLYHLLGIDLQGVHDVYAWEKAMLDDGESEVGSWTKNLSSCSLTSLVSPSQHTKHTPDGGHEYFPIISMDADMVQELADNLFALLALRDTQIEEATLPQSVLARSNSARNLTVRREAVAETIQIHYSQMKKFVGRRAANINKFMEEHPGIEIVNNQCRHSFTIYADTQETMDNALADIRPYQMPSSTSEISLADGSTVVLDAVPPDYFEPIFTPLEAMLGPGSRSSSQKTIDNSLVDILSYQIPTSASEPCMRVASPVVVDPALSCTVQHLEPMFAPLDGMLGPGSRSSSLKIIPV